MYLHVGQDILVREKDIIGIFDLDTSTVSKKTRDYLSLQERRGNIINASDEKLPKSFIVCKDREKTNKVFISLLMSNTLLKRKKQTEY